MSRHNKDHKRHRNVATSVAMKRLAAVKKCPACERKNALSVFDLDLWTAIGRCRYCGHEQQVRGLHADGAAPT